MKLLTLVDAAVAAHATQQAACRIVGITPRSLERWRLDPDADDLRTTPRQPPPNRLTEQERATILALLVSPAYRDLAPAQIVPQLADDGRYLASESTIYRLLREAKLLQPRGAARPPRPRQRPHALVATGPNQVWSWDITYLKSPLRGGFYYLYVVLDVWSRKIVGWAIHDCESSEYAAELVVATCAREGVTPGSLVLHSDNGSPMKGATLQATLHHLGIASSFSRPSVSNDNPYSESAFRTVKYSTQFPRDGIFASVTAAREWMTRFVHWYNAEHRHSGIRHVTPQQRHDGSDLPLLKGRDALYRAAKKRLAGRWPRGTRNWTPIREVFLNPKPAGNGAPAA